MQEYFYKWQPVASEILMPGTNKAKLLADAKRALRELGIGRKDYEVVLRTPDINEKGLHHMLTCSRLVMRGRPKQVYFAAVSFAKPESEVVFKLKFM
ncbi:hypothetical protein [Burkholderia multivorans]|uniref:hypothetical protein n=1 Tax=Burkholderia multivorans TaxID=87883 RepID=UPI0012FE5F59|nr:hypothetical protein [Burkholderia multivorans]MBU9472108.1 nitrile hydratase subunit alpha [Burkholderia multivorans]